MCSIYIYNKKWNPDLKLHLIEDGARNYCRQYDHYASLRRVLKILGLPLYADEFDDTVLFEPKLLPQNVALKAQKQPDFHQNKQAASMLSRLYEHEIMADEIENGDIIYFDQPITLKNSCANQDIESKVFDMMKEILPQNKIKIKKHPRFERKNVAINELKTPVWEPYLIKNRQKSEHLVLISLSSTALFAPKLLFGKEPTVIFIYQLFKECFENEGKDSEFVCYTNGTFSEAVKRFKGIYKNQNKVFDIKTPEELKSALKNIKNEA
jgi:hypothetical protein